MFFFNSLCLLCAEPNENIFLLRNEQELAKNCTHICTLEINESMKQAKKKCNLLIFFCVVAVCRSVFFWFGSRSSVLSAHLLQHWNRFLFVKHMYMLEVLVYTSHNETVYATVATKISVHSDRYKLQFHFEFSARARLHPYLCR